MNHIAKDKYLFKAIKNQIALYEHKNGDYWMKEFYAENSVTFADFPQLKVSVFLQNQNKLFHVSHYLQYQKKRKFLYQFLESWKHVPPTLECIKWLKIVSKVISL